MRSVAKHSYLKGRLGKTKGIAHTHYIQKRSGKDKDQNEGRPRRFFDGKSNDVDGDLVRQQIAGQKGVVVMHKLILSPGLENVEMQDYTRDLLQEFGDSKGLDLDWYGVVHENTEHKHAHIVIMGRDKNDREVRLRKADYEELRYLGDRYLEKYHTYERFQDRDLENLLDGGYARDQGDAYYERLLKDVKSDKSFDELAEERKTEKEREREEDDEKQKNRKQLEETGELDRMRKQFDDNLRRSLLEDRGLEPKRGRKQWILESKGRLLESHERYEISMARLRLQTELNTKNGNEGNSDRLNEIQEELTWLKGLVQEDFGPDAKKKDVEVNADLKQEDRELDEAEVSMLKTELKQERESENDKASQDEKPQIVDKASESKESGAGADRDKEEALARDEREQEVKDRTEKEEIARREETDREQREQEEREQTDREERESLEQEERARDDEDRTREIIERERVDEIKRQEQAAREESEKLFRLQMEADRLRDQQMESDRESTPVAGRSQLDEKIERYSQEIEQAKGGIDSRQTKVDDIDTRDFDLDRDVEQNWGLEQKLDEGKELDNLELDLDALDRDGQSEEREANSDVTDSSEMLGADVKGLLSDYEKLPEEERIAGWEKDAFDPEMIRGDKEPRENELDSPEHELTGGQENQSLEDKSQEQAEQNLQQQLQQLQHTIQVELQREFFAPSSRDERSEPEPTRDEKEKDDDSSSRER